MCDKADDIYGGRLPVHVRCLLDEFANIGEIPNFDKLIATIREPGNLGFYYFAVAKSVKDHLQGRGGYHLGQLRQHLVLGGKEKSTRKEISEMLGKETLTLSKLNPKTEATQVSLASTIKNWERICHTCS